MVGFGFKSFEKMTTSGLTERALIAASTSIPRSAIDLIRLSFPAGKSFFIYGYVFLWIGIGNRTICFLLFHVRVNRSIYIWD
ncbi:hypothetical protein VNO77_46214 [Canavalia gladiata]|uniref:Uncharacterized protein n=1 Tax=Canavalia gladiata TaxID=3824 RepID=A0AAN9PII2_CANGL